MNTYLTDKYDDYTYTTQPQSYHKTFGPAQSHILNLGDAEVVAKVAALSALLQLLREHAVLPDVVAGH